MEPAESFAEDKIMKDKLAHEVPHDVSDNVKIILLAREALMGKKPFSCLNKITGNSLFEYCKTNIYSQITDKTQIISRINNDFIFSQYQPQIIYPTGNPTSMQDNTTPYRFIMDQYAEWVKNPLILNFHDPKADPLDFKPKYPFFFEVESKERTMTVLKTIGKLQLGIYRLYSKHLTEDGKGFDYMGLLESPAFNKEFKETAEELAYTPLEPLTRSPQELKAFFINLYNILHIHSRIAFYIQHRRFEMNTSERTRFYNEYKYLIGGQLFTLNEIEHGVLRRNNSFGMSKFQMFKFALCRINPKGMRFSKFDSRLKFVVADKDPRIYFALNCGARSCPPIRFYEAEKIEKQLDIAALGFCDGETDLEEKGGKLHIRLSQIFDWYAVDFGRTKIEIIKYVQRYLKENERGMVQEYLSSNPKNVVLSYRRYDWSFNAKK